MFERFTERARQVVVLAQDEALALGHDHIGTEHLLLGLLREEHGLGAQALNGLGITADAVREQAVAIVGRGESAVAAGQIPFSPRGKHVLEASLREALVLGHNHIDTEHVLLGLVRRDDGTASIILRALGSDEKTVRDEVMRKLVGTTATAQPVATARPVTVRRRPWLAAEDVPASEALPGRRAAWLPSGSQLAVAWLLFMLALGAGILIGWAIWGT